MKDTQVPARDLYGPHAAPGDAHLQTIADLFAGSYFQQATHVRGASHEGPGPDWRLIRGAEANAREIGIRASIPDPAAAGTPQYAADLAQWGDGRGIGPGSTGVLEEPDGPEAGT
jgi:hypothetical protein